MTLTYLAAPYSHPDPDVMAERARKADAAAVRLMEQGFTPYSPLSHWHRAAQAHNLPTNANHWIEANRTMLLRCDSLHVLKLDGWRDSPGVAMEIQWAEDANMPIHWIET